MANVTDLAIKISFSINRTGDLQSMASDDGGAGAALVPQQRAAFARRAS